MSSDSYRKVIHLTAHLKRSLPIFNSFIQFLSNQKNMLNNDSTAQINISPNKKATTFRSKTKQKDNLQQQQSKKQAISFKMYLKQFPLGLAEDIIKIIESFQPIHNQFLDNLDSLKLYRMQLAALLENNWAEFMQLLKNIIVKLNRRTDKIVQDKESQIAQLLQINSKNEKEIQRMKQRSLEMQNIRQIQRAQLAVANSQVETVNRQMADIYDILRSDMGKILKYLTSVQQTKEKQLKEGSTKIYSSLQSFNNLLNNIQTQHKATANTLSTMRETIKAMARSTKSTTGTQVDESQLETKAANVFGSPQKGAQGMNFSALDASSLNVAQKGKYDHVIDKLKLKQKEQTHETYHPKKNTDKPWALTPILLTFLENMSKQNQAGRVLPWQYMKDLIHQIYQERIKFQPEMTSGTIGNGMLFDQFVVYYFLQKHRIRRLAQVKLLQFIISLKYYSKFWLKAETFCVMMDVMRFIPLFDQTDMYNYRTDYYTQNFFFQVYRAISSFEQYHEDDGTVYIPTKKVKKLIKGILFFSDQVSRSRLNVKLQKDIRIFDKVEHAQFDFSLMLFMQEYFAVRRKNLAQINRQFTKIAEKIEGYFSIDEILGIFNDFKKMYNSGEQFNQRYPVQSQLQIARLYLYAVTGGKNSYQITSTNFSQACQRYGFDSPFPFLHQCPKKKEKDTEAGRQKTKTKTQEQQKKQTKMKQQKQKIDKDEINQVNRQQNAKTQVRYINLNQERVDVSSKLFSQHFSLLKELKDYVTIFSTTLVNEKDPEILWKSFNQIKLVLEKGCSFLKYPLIAKQ